MTSSIDVGNEAAEVMKGWRNVARTVTRVRAGDTIVVEVEGGVVRREAPCDGVVYEGDTASIFVPSVRRGTVEAPVTGEAGPTDAGG